MQRFDVQLIAFVVKKKKKKNPALFHSHLETSWQDIYTLNS